MSDPTTVTAAQLDIGDLVTISGSGPVPCRVRAIRTTVPGVVWLYLEESTEASTQPGRQAAVGGRRLRRRVSLPLTQTVIRHERGMRGLDADMRPDDA